MKATKLNEEQAKVVREFTEYAKKLYVKYKIIADTVRSLKDLPPAYEELKSNSFLLAAELNETKGLAVDEENVLLDRGQQINKACFTDMMLCRLWQITRYAALMEPYVTMDINRDIQELCFKMRKISKAIL